MSPPQNPSPDGRPGGPSPRGDVGWPRWAVWLVVAMFISIVVFSFFGRPTTDNQIATSQFETHLEEKRVKSVQIDNQTGAASGTLKDGKKFTTNVGAITDDLNRKLADSGADYEFRPPQSNILGNLVVFLIPFLLLILVMVWINRRAQGQMGSIMQIGRSRAKVYNTEKPKTTFADVAGYKEPKQEIQEVIGFLKEPRKFKEMGAKVPKGVLLVGPPGTGKTLLARAVAGEAGVPFVSVTGSDFMEMFVGVGAARVRDLFQTARKQSPSVVFIDEIDSIGRKRGAGLGGGHDEREQTLNQLLSEMDGFESSEGIVMMAATNRPDILDPALLRPGRFDRQVIVPLPTLSERLEILAVHTKDKKLSDTVDLARVAKGTPGFSGADLANLTNEAALYAVRRGHPRIDQTDFDDARDRVIMGLKRESLAMSDEEKRITAYHEAGHALCGILSEHADEVHKVTILPIGMALGVTQFLPEERHIEPSERIEAQLVVALGGRVAEEIVFARPSTGASNDLQQATALARKMVREWGMSDKLGPIAYGDDSRTVFLGEDLVRGHEYSEATAELIDEEVSRIVSEARRRATHLLTDDREALDLVAEALLRDESIEGVEVERLLRVSRGEAPATPPAPAAPPQAVTETQAPAAPPVPQHKPGIVPPPMAPGVAH